MNLASRPGEPGYDGWTYTDENGILQRRRRNDNDAPIYDIDHMSKQELRRILALWRKARKNEFKITRAKKRTSGTGSHEFARQLFPTRPLHFRAAAITLRKMALYRLHGTNQKRYEALYLTLPPYAQFRRYFNVTAAIQSQDKKVLTLSDDGSILTEENKKR